MSRRTIAIVFGLSVIVLIATALSIQDDEEISLMTTDEEVDVIEPTPFEQLSFEDIDFQEPITTTTVPVATTFPSRPEPSSTTTEPPEPEEPEPNPEPVAPPPPEPDPEPEREPEPAPKQSQSTEAPQSLSGGWAALAQCESGGNFGTNTGNGYYGAFQFNQATWDGVVERMGRSDLSGVRASDVSASDQMAAAQQLYSERGSQPWPVCGAYL